jgi:Ca2+-binding RTX toxin-like protein
MANITGTIDDDNLLGLDFEGDLIFALDGNDIVNGLDGNDTLVGGAGIDSIGGSLGNDIIFGNLGLDTLEGNEGNDTILGGQDGDLIFEVLGDNLLFGNLGDDTLIGGVGNDTMFGGQGILDVLFGGGGNDLLSGDLGDDALFGCDPLAQTPGWGEIDTLTGGQGTSFFFLVNPSETLQLVPFYLGGGNSDFAFITDFKPATDKMFVQQLDLITFSNLTLENFGTGVGVFQTVNGQPDLMAFLLGIDASSLQLDQDFIPG